MKGMLYIDGTDAYVAYGVFLSEGAYDGLVCFPALKSVAYNDWHEQNGIDPDLSAPVLDAKSITLDMYFTGSASRYNAFIAAISDGAYHSFQFAGIGLTKSFRIVSCGGLNTIGGLTSFSITLSDDEPMKDYVYAAPASDISAKGDYLIDGTDVAAYGVRMLQGTLDSVTEAPAVKENLKRNSTVSAGVYYDGEKVTFKSRTAQLRCFMRAKSLTEFWQNRNALLYNLTQPNGRTLKVTELGAEIPFYYKSCSVDSFHPDASKVWFEFTLNVEFYKGGLI